MKKLLIIQLDDPYFLFETLQVLERNYLILKDFEFTILTSENSLGKLGHGIAPVISGVTTNVERVLAQKFDISVNLSLNEESWILHSKIASEDKIGPYMNNGQLFVVDQWSAYLLTLKARAPFLTFHLQEMYENILGIKSVKGIKAPEKTTNKIVFGSLNLALMTGLEQGKLVHFVNQHYPNIPIVDISEIDQISDLSQTVYIGPASFEAVQICEWGAKGIFLGSHFQGFNLMPSGDRHYFISSRGEKIHSQDIESFIAAEINGGKKNYEMPHSIYVTTEASAFGGYFKNLNNKSDDNYPFYQAHVVLWNYLLNLFDTSLDISKCSQSQVKAIKLNQEVITKLDRLYDYAMSSVDTVYTESKKSLPDINKVQGQLQNLREIEALTDQISQTHSFLRPILDYYRIRRGQNHGTTLLEQSQHTFLAYSEEHQALKALQELFSVTLRKNEVNI